MNCKCESQKTKVLISPHFYDLILNQTASVNSKNITFQCNTWGEICLFVSVGNVKFNLSISVQLLTKQCSDVLDKELQGCSGE